MVTQFIVTNLFIYDDLTEHAGMSYRRYIWLYLTIAIVTLNEDLYCACFNDAYL